MSLLYLDPSALVKLVAPEPETPALLSRLGLHPDVVSSALARVEVLRAVARAGGRAKQVKRARDVLARVTLCAVDDPILNAAATLAPLDLRSLDAIHLATALSLGADLDGLVGYDHRLNAAAETLGLVVISPA